MEATTTHAGVERSAADGKRVVGYTSRLRNLRLPGGPLAGRFPGIGCGATLAASCCDSTRKATGMTDGIAERANAAAVNFLASLNTPATEREAALITNAYAAGWIQGAYAGANEARTEVCKRRTLRRSTCKHNERG